MKTKIPAIPYLIWTLVFIFLIIYQDKTKQFSML